MGAPGGVHPDRGCDSSRSRAVNQSGGGDDDIPDKLAAPMLVPPWRRSEGHSTRQGRRTGSPPPSTVDAAYRGAIRKRIQQAAPAYLPAQPDSALFCVARQRGNWLQPQNGPKLPVRFSI